MSDLNQLRDLADQVRPPSFDSLVTTARRRNRSAVALTIATVVVVLLVGAGVITADDSDRSVAPVSPPDDTSLMWGRTQVPLYDIGQTDTSSGIETTILDFVDPFEQPGSNPPPGTHWAGLEIKTCLDYGHATAANAQDCELIDEDGNHLTARYTRGDVVPLMHYPTRNDSVSAGDCRTGWALWPLPENFTPVTALKVYHEGRNDRPLRPIAAWTLVETP